VRVGIVKRSAGKLTLGIAIACALVIAPEGAAAEDVSNIERRMDELLHSAHDPGFYDDASFENGIVTTMSVADHGCHGDFLIKEKTREVEICRYPRVVLSTRPESSKVVTLFIPRGGL